MYVFMYGRGFSVLQLTKEKQRKVQMHTKTTVHGSGNELIWQKIAQVAHQIKYKQGWRVFT